MKRTILFAVMIWATALQAEPGDSNTVVLYQVGSNGKYCVSYTLTEKGCISGTNDNGEAFNVLNFAKGKKVVFKNVSDAPHDMRFTGANAEDIPAQDPNGADAVKKIRVEDANKEKISCSFHGNQLAVGYRVPPATSDQGSGHKDPSGQAREAAAAGGGGDPLAKVQRTGLADVANEVLAKGRPADVSKLVQNRPELMQALSEVRPLLAQELRSQGIGGSSAPVAQTGGGSSLGGSLLAKNIGGAPSKADGQPAQGGGGAGKATAAPMTVAEALAVLSSGGGVAQVASNTGKEPRPKKAEDDDEEDEDEEGKSAIAGKRSLASVHAGEQARAAAEEAAALRASAGLGAGEGRGPASLRDRTKMRLVRGSMAGDEGSHGFFGLDHRIMIVLLLATIWMIFSFVMAATKRRRKEEENAERVA